MENIIVLCRRGLKAFGLDRAFESNCRCVVMGLNSIGEHEGSWKLCGEMYSLKDGFFSASTDSGEGFSLEYLARQVPRLVHVSQSNYELVVI